MREHSPAPRRPVAAQGGEEAEFFSGGHGNEDKGPGIERGSEASRSHWPKVSIGGAERARRSASRRSGGLPCMSASTT